MTSELPKKDKYSIGVISDTHGLLRPDVLEVFKNTDLIIHAGDIGSPDVLDALHTVAPVKAVRGNMDGGGWAYQLPSSDMFEVGHISFYVIHDVYRLDLDPEAAGVQVVISGHTHKASSEYKNNVLFLNPGSAGPFRPPVTVAILTIKGKSIEPYFVDLIDG